MAAIANYSTGAVTIDAALAAVPSAVVADARAVAEDTRAWVATDSAAAALAADSPARLFGSGVVSARYAPPLDRGEPSPTDRRVHLPAGDFISQRTPAGISRCSCCGDRGQTGGDEQRHPWSRR
jgi:hypothetical protein